MSQNGDDGSRGGWLGIGMILGVVLDSLALGLAVGTGIGLALGAGIMSVRQGKDDDGRRG